MSVELNYLGEPIDPQSPAINYQAADEPVSWTNDKPQTILGAEVYDAINQADFLDDLDLDEDWSDSDVIAELELVPEGEWAEWPRE